MSEVSKRIIMSSPSPYLFKASTIWTIWSPETAEVLITPPPLFTMLCATSKLPSKIQRHGILTIRQPTSWWCIWKKSKVSVSCILFFCMTILISSIQRTAVMISPAMGMITESLILLIKVNTSPFHPIGVLSYICCHFPQPDCWCQETWTLSLLGYRPEALSKFFYLVEYPKHLSSPFLLNWVLWQECGMSFKSDKIIPPPAISCFMPN